MSVKTLLATALSPLAKMDRKLAEPGRRLWAYARLCSQVPDVDPSVTLLGMPELRGTLNLRLGRNLYLYRELYWETQEEGRIEIGDNVVLSRGVHIVSFSRVCIGEGAMVGEYTSIRDANHRFGDTVSIRTSGHDTAPIEIGCNAWIARGVTVLPGVRIGEHSIVAANAVVNRDVPDGDIVAGIPAKRVGTTFRHSTPLSAAQPRA